MRQFIFATILFLSGCSTRDARTEDSKSGTDTVVALESNSITPEPQKETEEIDFPLDSLLKFDSESALKEVFGDRIKRSIGYYPEGMGEYPNTLLYPGTSNQVEFVWEDDSITFSGLAYINITGQKTGWKTKEGITLGTRLKELEKINRKPFTFSGFEWDYSGVVDWEEGHLYERKIFVSLEYPGETIPPEFEGLIGEQDLRSDSELAQKANPIVCEITMRKLLQFL